MTERTKLEEDVYWLGREIKDARRALWDGKTGKAFANIEVAEEHYNSLLERLEEHEEVELNL